LGNYRIEFDLIFLNLRNIILKLHIKPIIKIKACNLLHVNIFLGIMDGCGNLKLMWFVFLMVEWL